jgi:hypothetical protein
MEARKQKVLAPLVVASVLAITETASARDSNLGPDAVTLTVRVEDRAEVPDSLLKHAEVRATAVFRMNNLDLKWVHAQDVVHFNPSAPVVTLIIADTPASLKAHVTGLDGDVMGRAVPQRGRGYVYYKRILQMVTPTRDIITILGDVMAHELGHLMLPPGHSTIGIMQPTVNMASRRLATFSKKEASEIRQRILEATH